MCTDPIGESLYRAIVEASPDALIFSDFSGNIRVANPTAAEMLGFGSPGELIGLNILEFVAGQEKSFVTSSFENLDRNGRKEKIETTLVCKNGSTFPAELTGSFVRDSHDLPIGLITIIRDISTRKAEESMLATATDDAAKANQLKDTFISHISHEIRTPLNAILGFTELIREESENLFPEDIDSYFSIIEISCGRLIQAVEMILNLSRFQVGLYTPEKKTVNPELVIQKLIDGYQVFADQKSIALTFENTCGTVLLHTDVNCVSYPISIVLDNAIKYTRKGFVKVTMKRDLNNWLIVEVADTGIGMHPEFLQRIFEPSLPEETVNGKTHNGPGLSLAIARQLLRTIGAEMSVNSTHGVGTVLSLKLPDA